MGVGVVETFSGILEKLTNFPSSLTGSGVGSGEVIIGDTGVFSSCFINCEISLCSSAGALISCASLIILSISIILLPLSSSNKLSILLLSV